MRPPNPRLVLLARLCAALVLVGLAALLIKAYTWLAPALSIDRCLDRGGRWDYAADACDDGMPQDRKIDANERKKP